MTDQPYCHSCDNQMEEGGSSACAMAKDQNHVHWFCACGAEVCLGG